MASVRGFLLIDIAWQWLWRAFGLALVVGIALGSRKLVLAQGPALAPIYWQQRIFFVPYQANPQTKTVAPVTKVQLLLSRDGRSDWKLLQEATPNVQGFSYHAPADGEYWFALRILNQRGEVWPNGNVQPQRRIIVDSKQPELHLTGTMDAAGAAVVRYEANDINLQPETLILEARSDSGSWTPLSVGRPDVSQSDRLVGRTRWTVPSGTGDVELRASIADRAGHRTQATNKVAVTGPLLSMPSGAFNPRPQESYGTNQPNKQQQLTSPVVDPFRATTQLPSQNWPAANATQQLATTPSGAINGFTPPPAPSIDTPPLGNPYTNASEQGWPNRTPAQLIADGRGLPSNPVHNKALAANNGWVQPSIPPVEKTERMVNSRTFDVEYDLQSVGPWGVAKVELWGTHDGGRTWQSYGVDPDNRSPVRVTVSGAGVYGFRILVDGANGVSAALPRAGDKPELVVDVDLQPPTTKLLAADLGQGNQSGHLLVRWTAADTNLEPRPIGLFYSAFPNGPWSTIASGLENTGAYTWRIERHIPGRFYLRLEARDTAGNLATYQLPTPITLDRPQPTGHLRGIRSVEADPTRMDTANSGR